MRVVVFLFGFMGQVAIDLDEGAIEIAVITKAGGLPTFGNIVPLGDEVVGMFEALLDKIIIEGVMVKFFEASVHRGGADRKFPGHTCQI